MNVISSLGSGRGGDLRVRAAPKRTFSALLAAILIAATHGAHAEKFALVNGTIINPGSSEVRGPGTNAAIVIDGDHIESIGPKILPADAKLIDAKGKFILPGYIDTHVHFFQSGDIYTRPDAVDLTSVRPY
ncbi:MAG: hypothetical protein ABJB69_09605, partial [Spartobacteria bacterium]